jgi:predicted DNA-binding protein with PD1-like motif
MIAVRPGQEVVETMSRDLHERGVANGAVVSLIGTVDSACISTRPKGDASKDIRTEYEQPFELSGTGEIRDGKVHLHVVLGAEGDRTLAGHLHWAHVRTFFVNAYVEAL